MAFITSKFMAKIVAACVLTEAATTIKINRSLHYAESTQEAELSRSNVSVASGVQALKLSLKGLGEPKPYTFVVKPERIDKVQKYLDVWGMKDVKGKRIIVSKGDAIQSLVKYSRATVKYKELHLVKYSQ